MKWNILIFQIVYVLLNISIYIVSLPVQSHIGISTNAHVYTIYTLDHKATDLLYHLETGTVHKKDTKEPKSAYRYVHTSNKLPAQATILGYINKEDSNLPHYIYKEPNKIKK